MEGKEPDEEISKDIIAGGINLLLGKLSYQDVIFSTIIHVY